MTCVHDKVWEKMEAVVDKVILLDAALDLDPAPGYDAVMDHIKTVVNAALAAAESLQELRDANAAFVAFENNN